MKENLIIGLLAAVLLLLIGNTVILMSDDNDGYRGSDNFNSAAAAPSKFAASAPGTAANPTQIDQNFNPTANPAAPTTTPTTPAVPALPKTKMSFGKMAHDFGTINQNSENKHIFKFTNTGDKPLQISDAKGSCGCTVPLYPKEPILPGEEGEIEVVYKPGTQKDAQSKNVTITANTEPVTTQLTITANVIPE